MSVVKSDWEDRIDTLAALEDGWHDGTDGVKLSVDVVALVRVLIGRLEGCGRMLPAIFPMLSEDGMSMVWHTKTHVVTLRVYSPEELDLSRFRTSSETGKVRISNHEDFEADDVDELFGMLMEWVPVSSAGIR